MAGNSKREQILLKIVSNLEELVPEVVKKVSRRLPADLSDLDRRAATQLPLIVVMGKLPRLVETHGGGRSNRSADCQTAVSALPVEVYCYFMDNEDPDSTLSSLADDLYRVLNSDPSKGGLAIKTRVLPDSNIGAWDPYVAFKFLVEITYVHSLGGI
jgi:hypothetical protein